MQLPKRKAGKYAAGDEDFVMSRAKYDEIAGKLKKLEQKKPRVATEVSRLAELGDFSENVEYQLAKRRLRGILSAILILENQLKNAEVIESGIGDIVALGSTVTILGGGEKKIYTILGSLEVDPEKGIISHNSPIGLELLGKKKGEKFEFRDKQYAILKIK